MLQATPATSGMRMRVQLARAASRRALAAASGLAIALSASSVSAQSTAIPQDSDTATTVDEIVVTASRVAREGYTAPTPTTVIGAEQIAAAAPASVADYVNQLPALVGSNTPRIANTGASVTVGSNLFNLRSLGANRTLVLMDGRRVVPSTLTGNVDANLLPQALIERVDVVTGGASSAWGSDAVAGVVNFVVNRRFEGFSANFQGGVSAEGDAQTFKTELSYGRRFADDRGHLLLSATYNDDGGADPVSSRDWFTGTKVVFNPAWTATNGLPRRLVAQGVGYSNQTSGGLIYGPATVTVGGVARPNPLLNVRFGPGGAVQTHNPGVVSGITAFSGDSEDISEAIELAVPLTYQTLYGRLNYDVSPNVTVFGEASYAQAENEIIARVYERGGNITIRQDNAYLPTSVRDQMTTLGLSSISVGRMFLDWGALRGRNDREQLRLMAGLEGRFGSDWRWDAYVQHGRTDFDNGHYSNNPIIANFNLAVDAVRDPSTNQIVCRSALTNPASTCAPMNIFGAGSTSEASRNYVFGQSWQSQTIEQTVAAVTLRGSPFSTWAGEVSVATGAEFRNEQFEVTTDALSLTNAYFVGNFKPAAGEFDVTEAFVEAVVPLASGQFWAEQLDLNAAIRVTDYSVSGTVTTWKTGLTWDLNPQLRFRGVASRDIRAPNLNELFQGGATLNQTVDDPVTRTSYSTRTMSGGNSALVPETADARSAGVVYRPAWLDGLSLSIDGFDIEIDGAISTLAPQRIIDKCAQGITAQCAFITRSSATGPITAIALLPQNINSERVRGVDVEATYRTELASGDLTLRTVGTYMDERSEIVDDEYSDYAGQNANLTQPSQAAPRWRQMASAAWRQGPFNTTATARFISSGKLNNAWTSADIDDNSVPSVLYFDWSASYEFEVAGSDVRLYGAIQNLLDKDPPATPNFSTASTIQTGVNGYLYDLLGRQFRVGLSLKF